MSEHFSRTELLIGSDGMEKLQKARVAVFGVGGVGGYVVEALARSGVGTLDIIDADKVCLSNLNRQIIATHKTIGEYKVDAAKARILDINPRAVVNAYGCFYLPSGSRVTSSGIFTVADGKCELCMACFPNRRNCFVDVKHYFLF